MERLGLGSWCHSGIDRVGLQQRRSCRGRVVDSGLEERSRDTLSAGSRIAACVWSDATTIASMIARTSGIRTSSALVHAGASTSICKSGSDRLRTLNRL